MAEAAQQHHRRVRMLGRDPNASHRAANPLLLVATAPRVTVVGDALRGHRHDAEVPARLREPGEPAP
ncbi:MAG: hypothetical protein AB7O78_11935 [Thermoleophilia bacterium]